MTKPNPLKAYTNEYETIKELLRERKLPLNRATLAVVLTAKKLGKYVNTHEIRKVLKELGYEFKDNSVTIALSKYKREGLIKSIRLGRISYHTIDNNKIKDVIDYILLYKGIRSNVVKKIVETVE